MIETFVIKIQQIGAEQAARSIKNIEENTKKTVSIMAFFRQALVALSAVRVAQTFIDFADSTTRLDNRLRVATKSSEEFARAQKFIYAISRQTRTEVEANAVIYSRLLQSTQNLKFSSEDLEKVMLGLASAVKVGGASSQEAKNALIQFSQAVASGSLRGDELNSVVEQLPVLANAIGREFGVADGALRNFAKNNPGILNTEKVLRGVLKASADLQRQAAAASLTIGESFVVLSNSIKIFLGQANESYGVLGLISQAVLFLADNLNAIIVTLVAFGVALAAVNFAVFISSVASANNLIIRMILQLRLVTAAQTLWNAAMIANPIGAIVAAVTAFIAALVLAYQYIPGVATVVNYLFSAFLSGVSIVLNVAAALGGPLLAAWNILVAAVQPLIAVVQALWSTLVALLQPLTAIVAPFFSSANASTMFTLAIRAAFVPLQLFINLLTVAVTVGLWPFVNGINAVVKILNSFGIVTDETAKAVDKATVEFNKQAAQVLSTENVMKIFSDVIKGNTTDQLDLEKALKRATKAIIEQQNAGKSGTGHSTSKMDAVNAKFEALYGKSENLNASTKRLSSSTSSLNSALATTVPKTEEMAMGTDQMSMSMVNGANSANQLSQSLNGVTASGQQALKTMEQYIRSGIFSGKDQFSSGVTITPAPLTGVAKTVTDMGGTYAFNGLNSGAVSAKVTDSRTGNTFSQTGLTKGSLDAAFTKWLAQQDKIVASMQKAADATADAAKTTKTVKMGSLGGGAIGINTEALNRNTAALSASSQDYMDLVNKLYNKLDLARQNVSGYYNDPSALFNSQKAGVSKLPGYASGVEGVFKGVGGRDNNMFMARVSSGEGVKITPKSEMKAANNNTPINVTINATDAGSIIRNESQVRKVMARAVASAQRSGRA